MVYGPTYMFWSRYHWHWLVNGYSGYTPWDVVDTAKVMDSFPDEDSIDRLKALTVRYVLVHQAFYRAADFADLMTAIAARPRTGRGRPLPRLDRGYADI